MNDSIMKITRFFFNKKKVNKKDVVEIIKETGQQSGLVQSVFGRIGQVIAQLGDYDAAKITNAPSGSITATNVQSAINQLNSIKQTTSLNSGNILVGNASNLASPVSMSGEATISEEGELTLDNESVINKVLTGYSSQAGTLSENDSILQAIEKLNGNDNIVSVSNTVVHSTSVITGGFLTVGSPNTTFSISDGTGMVVNNTITPATLTPVSWSGKTNIPATFIAAAVVSYVAIDITGSVVQQLTPFTNAQRRDLIVLGSMFHTNLTTIDDMNQFSEVGISPLNQVSDLASAIGKINISGNIFSANGANLQVNKSTGKMYAQGSNWEVDKKDPHVTSLPSLTSLTFQYRFQNGTNGATGININPNIYDLAGVSTAVPTNKFTIQRVFLYVSNQVKIQPGQNLYGSLAEAKAAIQTETFVTNIALQVNALLRAYIIVKQGTTNLESPTNAAFFFAAKFSDQNSAGGISVSNLQNVYDNSTSPEILTDSTRGALSIRRGSAQDSDNILEVLNGAGIINLSIDANGVISGFSTNQPQSDNSQRIANTSFVKKESFINSLIF